ncbi:MAG: hypothetical protein ABSC62_12930 [Terracidiphilus sp.]|jgi:tetratricopeptide (TPR) repeat protein
MKNRLGKAVLLLLGIGCVAASAGAQKPTPEQNVTVLVVNVLPQPRQPVKGVRVALSYLDSGLTITDAQQVTNSGGEALLLVSPDASQRGNLRIEIAGATGLVIYEPADGQLPDFRSTEGKAAALPATVQVSLLPKGSLALTGPAQIEAALHRMLLQVNSLKKQNLALKAEVAEAQNQKVDLGAAIAEWAQASGFTADQVNQQVQQWAQNIQRQPAQATTEQKALAEVALKHYASAAQLFDEAAATDKDELDAEEQAFLNARRDKLRQLINDREQSASASQLAEQYRLATQTLETAEATAAAEYRKHPGDRGFHELWLRAVSDLGAARRAEGEVSPASQSLGLLAQSVEDFESLVRDYAALGDRRESAAAQAGLGSALADKAARVSGDKAAALYDRAAQAYQDALAVRTRTDLPQDWAATQNDLGNALADQAQRASGDKATALFDQAVQAFHQALEVITRANQPQEWARTQFNLGIALTRESEHALGAKAVALLDAAVQAFGKALEVDTKADLPQRWAITQDALGLALMDEGLRSSQANNAALLDRAVQAFKSALEVIARDGLPQAWAQIQNNLGSALEDEAIRASDEKAPALFDQAAQAYQSALEVYTKADLPQDWGRAQINLGLTWMQEGLRASGDKAGPLLAQAVQAFEKSLEVFTKADLPQYWATAQLDLGDALASEALHTGGDQARVLFDQAAQAYQRALEVDTKADLPEDWAETQMNIMEVSFMAARYSACIQRVAVLTDDSLSAPQAVVRDTIEFACQWGVGDKSAARQTEKVLLSKSAMLEAAVWDFTGSLQILSASPAFSSGRASWIALFTAVQNGDRAGMTAALHQLEPILQQ